MLFGHMPDRVSQQQAEAKTYTEQEQRHRARERELVDDWCAARLAVALLCQAVCAAGAGPAVWCELRDLSSSMKADGISVAMTELESAHGFFDKRTKGGEA